VRLPLVGYLYGITSERRVLPMFPEALHSGVLSAKIIRQDPKFCAHYANK
jgi:hypothetical protein